MQELPSRIASLEAWVPILNQRVENVERQMTERMTRFEIKQDESMTMFADKLSLISDKVATVAERLAVMNTSYETAKASNSNWLGKSIAIVVLMLSVCGGLFGFVQYMITSNERPRLEMAHPQ